MASNKQREEQALSRREWLRRGGFLLLGLGGTGIKAKAVIQGNAEAYGLPELAAPQKEYSNLQDGEILVGIGAATTAGGCANASRRELINTTAYTFCTYILADEMGQLLGETILQNRAADKKRRVELMREETKSTKPAPDWNSRLEARDRSSREDRER